MTQTRRGVRWLTMAMAAIAAPHLIAQTTPASSSPATGQQAAPPTAQTAPPTTTAPPAPPAKPKIKDAYQPLLHGQLVVWLVEPSGSGPTMTMPGIDAPPPIVYQERTPGTFGQNAASYGTDASKFGVDAGSRTIARVPNDTGPDADADAAAKAGYREQASGSFGQNAGGYGTAASNQGQTAGSFGQNAGNYGIDASRYGVDASDYGTSLSGLNGATTPPPAPPPPVPFTDQVQSALNNNFPALKVQYVDVGSSDVKARLRSANSTKDYPDVVILDGFATSWPGFPQDVRDALLTGEAPEPNRRDRRDDRLPPSWFVTRRAQHAATAHALSVYLNDNTHAKADDPATTR